MDTKTHNRQLRILVIQTHVARPLARGAVIDNTIAVPVNRQAALSALEVLITQRLQLSANGARQGSRFRDLGHGRRRGFFNHLFLRRGLGDDGGGLRRGRLRLLLGITLELLPRRLLTTL